MTSWKHIAMKIIVVLIIFMVPVTSRRIYTSEAQKEVVSIYNDNFTTPISRYPYFIEVYRCSKIYFRAFSFNCMLYHYPVPATMSKIEIVVPDVANDERDPDTKKKFYKYIVFNHTSCTCGELRERKLYNTSSNNLVSESYFMMNYQKNPKNVRSTSDYCKKAQIRYKLHAHHFMALPPYKYFVYKQCLPGCVVKKSEQRFINTVLVHAVSQIVRLKNDVKCEEYDNKKSKECTPLA
ncbi:uncharacterized protein LOC114540392 [Dendronephthya gigantea]|uniref:uncharacterized protein LOC114540392 n=1 Tax=Dendronephthya gigantea TaxID=151771 RepID=UPI001069AFBA|nr:uncharacterized protein LOC114540392 [Dendronephthya gigantea]